MPAYKELVQAHFIQESQDPEKLIKWKKFDCEIKDSKGEVVFSLKNVEAPESWSQLAVEIAASKYFRLSAGEKSVRQMVNRVVSAITKSGQAQGYFSSKKEAEIFSRELKYILLTQKAFFNSPVWFNCGIFQSYGINVDSTHYAWDFKKNQVSAVRGAYERPQVSACFIQSVDDDLESIFELAKTEAKLFKFGSGSGTNFSNLRSKYDHLKGGGTSSGLISFLEVLDRGAGSVKSGGVTRRAAKMVCLDVDHPEIMEFISWKAQEEKKAHALIRQGYESDFEGEAYKTVSGQNANNSVRATDQFMKSVAANKNWKLKSPISNKVLKTVPAEQIWKNIISSAWFCADPGLQFSDTISQWHTCPESGEIRASNPCSEYLFLDDTACNLASLNLLAFLNEDFQWQDYRQTARVIFLAQEILVDFASYPTEKIALNSHQFRPLGLGYAGLGALLMRMALSYDSEAGRAWAGALTAVLHGEACLLSTQVAAEKKPFEKFKKNKKSFFKVMKKHQAALKKIEWKFLPVEIKLETENLYSEFIRLGEKAGYRNAQMTVMAPTGTIGLVMDSDTTGIEPEFSLVKWKKMVGGGRVKISSSSMLLALEKLNYSKSEIESIEKHILETGDIQSAEKIKKQDLPIFLCAQPVESKSAFLSADAHLKMMAAVQSFLSGGISKTVNLPADVTSQDVSQVYKKAWEMGLKAVAIYRDGSKKSQPLSVHTGAPAAFKCPECGGETEIAGGCYRCTNCGYSTGCVS
jgi:ribonucleoside-diphosphate reductase alpha chain